MELSSVRFETLLVAERIAAALDNTETKPNSRNKNAKNRKIRAKKNKLARKSRKRNR